MKNYSSITDAYLASHGLTKVSYLSYLGEIVVAYLTKKEIERREKRGVVFF